MPDQEKPSLYDRLGGVYNVATVVETHRQSHGRPRLNANPRVDEAHHRVIPQGQVLATEMVCWATGGPQTYLAVDGDSHRHLMIRPSSAEP